MISPRSKKRILLVGIALICMGGFSVVYSLDINVTLTCIGLLLACQAGFLLFFLSRVRFRRH
ncbi:MAG: hypothetical protein WA902_19790 [Thermosynechococcaceae cyanobacterium]